MSIEEYAKRIVGKSLRQAVGSQIIDSYKGSNKGKLGQLVEELYFLYLPNSSPEPDFPEAGLELKTTSLKKLVKGGFSPKERLSLNLINFMEEHSIDFEESSFWKKNKHLLILFFLYEKDKNIADYILKLVKRWEFPEEDLKIIKDDWKKIVSKIKDGKAHELSEGDTLYLGACTKGNNKESLREQPFNKEMAMQRAYSLKTTYLKYIIRGYLDKHSENQIVGDISQYSKDETFEEYVEAKFKPFYDMSCQDIFSKLNVKPPAAKNKFAILAQQIMGIKGNKIEEFDKADIIMKTLNFEHTGTLKESMSFAQIKYEEIVTEKWEESYWYETVNKRFFFVIFQKNKLGIARLKRVMFWNMPYNDIAKAKIFWSDTKRKIKKDTFNNFYKLRDNRIFHVRPKGKNNKDLMKTADGKLRPKLCYWLNAKYIKSVVSE